LKIYRNEDDIFNPTRIFEIRVIGEVATFRWREPPPIGCGFPYDRELENRPYGGPKTCPKNPLDRIFSPATIRVVDYPSFTKNLPTQPLTFWRKYERGFPEGTDVKVPEEYFVPLEPFFLIIWKLLGALQSHTR
jgi:hypothetical protein